MGRIAGDDRGFSIVEVLVVVVIISILASISVPVFFHQRERGWQAATESALKNASTAMTSAAVSQNGSFDGISIPQLVANEGLQYDDESIDLVVASTNESNFCLSARHRSWGATMYFDSAESRPDFVDCSDKY